MGCRAEVRQSKGSRKLRVYRHALFYLLILVLVTYCLDCTAQDSPDPRVVDSLEQAFRKSSNEEDGLKTLFTLFRLHRVSDSEAAYRYADRAFMLASRLGDSLSMVMAINGKGNVLMDKGNLQDAVGFFDEALNMARRLDFKDQIKYIINNLALAHTYGAQFDKALDYNFESLRIRENEGKPTEISVAYNNIGLTYFNLKDYENALTFYKKAYQIKLDNNVSHDLERALINLGLTYNQLRDYSNALRSLKEAFSVCEENGCKEDVEIELHSALAEAYYGSNDLVNAETEALYCIQRAQLTGSPRFLVNNYNLMARLRMRQDKLSEARAFLERGTQKLGETDLRSLRLENYHLYADLYAGQVDYEEAARYLTRYNELKDSIYHEDLIRNIARIQSSYEERQNIKTIAVKDELLHTQEEVIRRQELLNIATAIIAILALLIIFIVYRSNRVVRRANYALSQAKETIEDQNRQLKSMNQELEERVSQRTRELSISNESLTRVNDELDNFIYKTSHDIRGPLASLKGICNVAIMDVKDDVALGYLQKLDVTAERLNAILTRLLIINQINHATINQVPISFDEIIEEILYLERKKGVPVSMDIEKIIEPNIKLLSDKEIIRIILENLINNAIKFYNDSPRINPFIKIHIHANGEAILARVIDNGIGIGQINPEKIFQMFNRASERSETGGIGLYLTKTAADKIGARVGLTRTEEGYTEFYVAFPKGEKNAPAAS